MDVAHHLPTDTCKTDPDLAAVVAAWSELPEALRAGIVAMVKAAVGKDGGHSLSEDGVPRPAQFTRPPRQTELETCGRL